MNKNSKIKKGNKKLVQSKSIGYTCFDYLSRNMDVAKVYGLNAGLCSIYKRMRIRKDCPQWFLKEMKGMIERSSCLIRPLVIHRDELSKGGM